MKLSPSSTADRGIFNPQTVKRLMVSYVDVCQLTQRAFCCQAFIQNISYRNSPALFLNNACSDQDFDQTLTLLNPVINLRRFKH